ncbi:unnamed protein product [Didymodactylos carnosus]|uniref:Uncharacterized protein n=1 Tax=Didymodactylos carnosus TaxID=1234261 RepID=A0A8S2FBN8_9BILA|nr:unnamed protein product [Didymodactylos carnosus]CAF4216425.1 unnamed protein product [Didymodactylos carnosus]
MMQFKNTVKSTTSDEFITSPTSIDVDELSVSDYNQLRYTKYQYCSVKSLFFLDKSQLTIWDNHPWPSETFERLLVSAPNIHLLRLNGINLLRLLKSSDQIRERLANMIIKELDLSGDEKVWSTDNVELFIHIFSNLETFRIYNVRTANEFYAIMPIILRKFTKLVTLSVFLTSRPFLPSKSFLENRLQENTAKLNFYLICSNVVHIWL